MFKIDGNKKISFYFGLLCLLNPIRVVLFYMQGFLGAYFAVTFLPLVILGMIDLIKNNNWKMLAFGMIFTLHCHLITFALCVIFVLVYSLFKYKKFLKEKIKILQLLKAGVISLFSCLDFLVPFIYYYSDSFKLSFNKEMLGIQTCLSFDVPILFAVIIQVVLIISLIKINSILKTKIDSNILCDSLCLCVWSIASLTNLFPWELIENIPFLGSIQFSTRILVLFSIYLIFILLDFMISIKDFNLVIICFLLAFQFLPSVSLAIANNITPTDEESQMIRYEEYENMVNAQEGTYIDVIAAEYLPINFTINNKTFEQITQEDLVTNRYPLFSDSVNSFNIQRENLTTTVMLDTEKPVDITIPLVYYKGYKCYFNDNEIPVYESDGKIYLKNISSGEIIIKYENQLFEYISAIISIISFCGFSIYCKQMKTKNKAPI